jgi:5-methylcytosine-specific restriction protein A
MRVLGPCTQPGCPHRSNGRGLCLQHERARKARVDVERIRYDKERPSAARRGYDRTWRARRALYISNNPTCVVCGAEATDPHHITRKALGGDDDEHNLMALCHSCHSARTGREVR